MPGREKGSVGRYISKNYQRPDIGKVKVKVNRKTDEVEQVTVETKLFADSTNSDHLSVKSGDGSTVDLEATEFHPVEEKSNADVNVDALIIERKKNRKKNKKHSTNKQKNTN